MKLGAKGREFEDREFEDREFQDLVVDDAVVDHATDRGMVRALDHVDLSVAGGTSVAVMGPSGCGKSTLLGLVAGLAVPTAGTVTVGSHRVSSMNERDRVRFRRRTLGMVYQADNLLPHLTVEENVGLQLSICRRNDGDPRDDTTAEVLDQLGLAGLARRLPDQLSGGQRQRVAVARAVVHSPAVILADEPTGALDPRTAGVVIELIIAVQHRIGATLVVVTHDPGIAARLDRIVTLAPTIERESIDAR